METILTILLWALSAWVSARAIRAEVKSSSLRGSADCIDKVVAVFFGLASIAMPAGLLVLVDVPAWFWAIVFSSCVGLALIAFRAAKGLPLTASGT